MVTPPVEDILERARNLSPAERASLIEELMTTRENASRPQESILGKYRGCFSSVDEFLRRKHEENDIEDPPELT